MSPWALLLCTPAGITGCMMRGVMSEVHGKQMIGSGCGVPPARAMDAPREACHAAQLMGGVAGFAWGVGGTLGFWPRNPAIGGGTIRVSVWLPMALPRRAKEEEEEGF